MDVVAGAVEFSVREETAFLPSGKAARANGLCLKHCGSTTGQRLGVGSRVGWLGVGDPTAL